MVCVCRKTYDWGKRPDCEPYCACTVHIGEAPSRLVRKEMDVLAG